MKIVTQRRQPDVGRVSRDLPLHRGFSLLFHSTPADENGQVQLKAEGITANACPGRGFPIYYRQHP